MEEGALPRAPIWSDLTTFDARRWCGAVDCVIGGFPCQPASVAGKRAGRADERWLWPHVARIIHECKPELVFLENVPGLLTVDAGEGYKEVLSDLAALGFDAEWGVLAAAAVGAPHKRERVFIMAHANGALKRRLPGRTSSQQFGASSSSSSRCDEEAGDADLARRKRRSVRGRERADERAPWSGSSAMADAASGGATAVQQRGQIRGAIVEGSDVADSSIERGGTRGAEWQGSERISEPHQLGAFPPGPVDVDAWQRVLVIRPDLVPAVARNVADTEHDASSEQRGEGAEGNRSRQLAGGSRDGSGNPTIDGKEGAQPELRRVADGAAYRVDRLRALGNGVVPKQAAVAFCMLVRKALGILDSP